MTNISALNQFYLKTIRKLAIIGVFPYAATFSCIASPEYEIKPVNIAAGAAVCAILTFVIPILPIATAITLCIAKIGLILAAASMLFAYPVAMVKDCINSTPDEGYQPSATFTM